jgi:hypothetical protein
MLALAAAAAALSAMPPDGRPHRGPGVQAQAFVRIISGAVVHLREGAQSDDVPRVQQALVHVEGTAQPAKLIEFE